MKRILVACMGNVLRRDDGFGVVLAQHLVKHIPGSDQVHVIEVGIGGIHLVQELMNGYDVLIIVDAVDRQSLPGTLHFMEVQAPDLSTWPASVREDFLADMHYATPTKAIILAKALGVLPPKVFIVGCQPEEVETLSLELSEPVKRAVIPAVKELIAFINEILEAP